MNSINLKLDFFEGPLDLLFHLIVKNEIDIYDIPIAQLTDQYILYINDLKNKNMENISEFIIMAATLLEIKSKMLLPKVKIPLNDEDADPREQLVARLIEYKRFKEIANIFKETEIFVNKVAFKNPEVQLIEFLIEDKMIKSDDLLNGITINYLHDIFIDVLSRRELRTDKVRASFSSVQKDDFTIENRLSFVRDILKYNKEIMFSEIFAINCTKTEIVVTFLAVLEMIKLKIIKIIQHNSFDEIYIRAVCENV